MTDDVFPGQTMLLDATERLIYAGGIHATGMDAIVKASGIARKTLYRHYATKEALVAAALARRDQRWMRWFVAATSCHDAPTERLLSIFPALRGWFAAADFRGCAFLNAAGETGDPAHPVREAARAHKARLLRYLVDLTTARGGPEPQALAMAFLLLIDGAISAALVFGGADFADDALHAATRLLAASQQPTH